MLASGKNGSTLLAIPYHPLAYSHRFSVCFHIVQYIVIVHRKMFKRKHTWLIIISDKATIILTTVYSYNLKKVQNNVHISTQYLINQTFY